MITMNDINLRDQRVIIRVDFNVPLENGVITSDTRIRAALPTIQQALNAGAKVLLLSHLGRPRETHFDAEFSLAPVAQRLSQLLQKPVPLLNYWPQQPATLQSGEIALAENVRFNKGEKSNDAHLAQQMAAQCDVFIMDAFGTAHRAEASTYGIAQYSPKACAGLLLSAELTALSQAVKNPRHPVVTIVGGSKVSTKLALLQSLIEKSDHLIVGGGIANTFLAAEGLPVGRSLYEPDLVATAQELLHIAKARGTQIPLPLDVVVAKTFSADAEATVKSIADVAADEMILDIGPATQLQFTETLARAGTIIWNGPVGVFELAPFSIGTQALTEAIATSSAFSLAGGGDTLAAIEKYQVADKISYISTGGGAFLEFLEGKVLPAVEILEQRG